MANNGVLGSETNCPVIDKGTLCLQLTPVSGITGKYHDPKDIHLVGHNLGPDLNLFDPNERSPQMILGAILDWPGEMVSRNWPISKRYLATNSYQLAEGWIKGGQPGWIHIAGHGIVISYHPNPNPNPEINISNLVDQYLFKGMVVEKFNIGYPSKNYTPNALASKIQNLPRYKVGSNIMIHGCALAMKGKTTEGKDIDSFAKRLSLLLPKDVIYAFDDATYGSPWLAKALALFGGVSKRQKVKWLSEGSFRVEGFISASQGKYQDYWDHEALVSAYDEMQSNNINLIKFKNGSQQTVKLLR